MKKVFAYLVAIFLIGLFIFVPVGYIRSIAGTREAINVMFLCVPLYYCLVYYLAKATFRVEMANNAVGLTGKSKRNTLIVVLLIGLVVMSAIALGHCFFDIVNWYLMS